MVPGSKLEPNGNPIVFEDLQPGAILVRMSACIKRAVMFGQLSFNSFLNLFHFASIGTHNDLIIVLNNRCLQLSLY